MDSPGWVGDSLGWVGETPPEGAVAGSPPLQTQLGQVVVHWGPQGGGLGQVVVHRGPLGRGLGQEYRLERDIKRLVAYHCRHSLSPYKVTYRSSLKMATV